MAGVRLSELPLPGAMLVEPDLFSDQRGEFRKLFAASHFPALCAPWAETFVSTSRPGVLRGMHLQVPPHAHDKLVVCLAGRVLDAVLDLRRGSSSFGRHCASELDGTRWVGTFIPAGCAHGFCVLGDVPATLLYLVTSEHAPGSDAGVRWDSFGMTWPITNPVLSGRDTALPTLAEFVDRG